MGLISKDQLEIESYKYLLECPPDTKLYFKVINGIYNDSIGWLLRSSIRFDHYRDSVYPMPYKFTIQCCDTRITVSQHNLKFIYNEDTTETLMYRGLNKIAVLDTLGIEPEEGNYVSYSSGYKLQIGRILKKTKRAIVVKNMNANNRSTSRLSNGDFIIISDMNKIRNSLKKIKG